MRPAYAGKVTIMTLRMASTKGGHFGVRRRIRQSIETYGSEAVLREGVDGGDERGGAGKANTRKWDRSA
jgi:hypothetical protein